MRSELTPTQLSEHLVKRKELCEARRNSETNSSETRGRGRPAEFPGETADLTGTTRQQVSRAVSRADGSHRKLGTPSGATKRARLFLTRPSEQGEL